MGAVMTDKQHTSRFIINDILKATPLALTNNNCYCYYSFVLSTELFYKVQVIKFLHVNRQLKVFYHLAVVFSCSCLSLISRLFMFTFSLDCKTVCIFAYSSTREQSNKRSKTRLKTESETGERR